MNFGPGKPACSRGACRRAEDTVRLQHNAAGSCCRCGGQGCHRLGRHYISYIHCLQSRQCQVAKARSIPCCVADCTWAPQHSTARAAASCHDWGSRIERPAAAGSFAPGLCWTLWCSRRAPVSQCLTVSDESRLPHSDTRYGSAGRAQRSLKCHKSGSASAPSVGNAAVPWRSS